MASEPEITATEVDDDVQIRVNRAFVMLVTDHSKFGRNAMVNLGKAS